MMLRRLALVPFLALLLHPTVAISAQGEWPQVTTIAAGNFFMPTGIAYDRRGRLYISDAGAQRIDVLEPGGVVRTLAGGGAMSPHGPWVVGGYRDAQGADARFNQPAGIAVRRSGTIYVADTLNHCIREISPDGVVRTYAGSAQEAAQRDGRGLDARFDRPMGMAIDAGDNLYVADYSGIRKIDTAGNVTTIQSFGAQPYAVALFDGPLGVTLFAGDKYGIVARPAGAHDATDDRRFLSQHGPSAMTTLGTNADRPLGNPAYLTALDQNTVAFTDARTNTVRLLEVISGETKLLAGTPSEDASGNTGGYRDGEGTQTKFFAPMGIVRAPDGSLTVADGGNKRIRRLSTFFRTDPWAWLDQAYPGIPQHPAQSEYRIAYVGNSYIWYDTYWSDSIEGVLQRRLAEDPYWHAKSRTPRVIPVIYYSLDQVAKFAQTAAQSGLYQMVVFDLNWGTVQESFPGITLFHQAPGQWQAPLSDGLRSVSRTLGAKGIPLLIVTHPIPFEVSPNEAAWLPLAYEPKAGEDLSLEMAQRGEAASSLEAAVRESGVPALDLRSILARAEAAGDHRPLYGAGDYHFTQYGRALIAAAIGQKLLQLAPWRR